MVFVPAARPPQHYELVHEWTLESPSDVSRLRSEIAERAIATGDWDAEAPEVLDRLVLVCSELSSNALIHARPPVCASLQASPSRFLVDVSDDVLGTSPVLAHQPDEGGLGLALTSALASSSGWYVEGGRKHVWATFIKRAGAARAPVEKVDVSRL
ncbi:ATP-binding protein [Sanguibacter inulinus]|jgi:anti-sigma regulatory factor (Ser/Thr protein kinase)|uniref:ATP-binding protein n=1 Tax=Sanguibacter inulinus TaxID=60922 RepID=A0A853EXL9_9MICO|nr:ATP-binding protein [Sanguibacter inulinus]MBF0724272.1 ATP-binding protein [Sanguibacter inulinus]NYS95417.1 ATP-binding protein [Sanguibacter inulinus]